MPTATTPPYWAIYLVNRTELIVVPLAFGLALLLALRVARALADDPFEPGALALLPRPIVALGTFALFYAGFAELLTGFAGLVRQLAPAFTWSFTPPFAPAVPLAPALLFDAGILVIAALWLFLTGRAYRLADDDTDPPTAETPDASADQP